MFTKSATQDVEPFIIVHWLLMSLCAGIMNAAAFIGFGTFATHVTGFATLFGVHAAQARVGNAVAALAVPLFFLIGCIASGLLVEARVRQNKTPHYDSVMYFCCFLLVTACAIGSFRSFDPVQTYLHLRRNFVLLSLISLSSGLINAALSSSPRATVRITHLTGVTTDLGRGIAELISLRMRGLPGARQELRLNLLRFFTILSFAVGSLLGVLLFQRVYFYVLLIPAAYFAYAGQHGRRIRRSFQRLDAINQSPTLP